MARPRKAVPAGRRTWRQKLNMRGAVIVGSPRRSSIVYGYCFPSYPGRVKIGYSRRGLNRVIEQSTAFPERPRVLFVIHDARAKAIEAAFHQALAHRQSDVMGTEWFDVGWLDLMRASPILRKAVGARSSVRAVKWLMTLALLVVGLVLAPPLMAAATRMAEGADAARLFDGVGAYLGALIDGDGKRLSDLAGAMLDYALSGRVHWAWTLPGLAPVPLLCWLPWRRWRRTSF